MFYSCYPFEAGNLSVEGVSLPPHSLTITIFFKSLLSLGFYGDFLAPLVVQQIKNINKILERYISIRANNK